MSRNHVKIRFPLEQDESGYPPESSETMWAVPLDNGLYIIDNIPFYAKLISDGDIVSAINLDGDLTFDKVLELSRNCTIRIVMLDDSDGSEVRILLEEIGCKVEGSGTFGFFSVSFDKDLYQRVIDLISRLGEDEIIDYEESSLR
ncbi:MULTISPECIES: DUF4265 domain-containing protein [unclassified Sphingopyxis]|uniref:DUF4265 domain-containing protein n=1 Tax=Alphaproteobacteria TaxID=28211 RepID=UPI0028679CBF|nr:MULTISPECIES: DUF4265 domain-containing protein [unclassified Sphingopyxis]MDR7062038.1 hypothetical protein [Sphingopyxis sp. BE235]MDR7182496.1 hypothetical protein [Sphingopyxis sp. BE249]